MIFVSAGTATFPRLVKKMDEIAGKVDEKVVIQKGYTEHLCQNAECFDFSDYIYILELIKNARIVVSHDGVGAIMAALQLGKPIIAVPRLKHYGELYYDNKGEMVNQIARQGYAIKVVYDVNDIELLLKNIESIPICLESQNYRRLENALSEYISQL